MRYQWLFPRCLDVPSLFEQQHRHLRLKVTGPNGGSLVSRCHIVCRARLGIGRVFVLTESCCKLLYLLDRSWG
ncbi:hypothetical protein HanIR_Chr12g0595441 [Helianthus annuus]|nr:hypothetical protein HanIR_Chr12g0595441 [Helianthus annuus]